jgi:hypothetical protein
MHEQTQQKFLKYVSLVLIFYFSFKITYVNNNSCFTFAKFFYYSKINKTTDKKTVRSLLLDCFNNSDYKIIGFFFKHYFRLIVATNIDETLKFKINDLSKLMFCFESKLSIEMSKLLTL